MNPARTMLGAHKGKAREAKLEEDRGSPREKRNAAQDKGHLRGIIAVEGAKPAW
jgi:hypothetical protein